MGEVEAAWRIAETADYLCARNYAVVAAQFPDELLGDATRIATLLEDACKARGHPAQVYVLADTTYNSLSVDEVAASHVDAQCVVHYGRASLTALSRLPAFFVFPRRPLDAEAAAEALAGSELMASCAADGATVVVLLDQPHLEQLPALRAALRRRRRPGAAGAGAALVFADVPTRHLDPASLSTCGAGPSPAGCCAAARPPGSAAAAGEQRAAGYTWALPAGADPACCAFAWVGDPSAPALSELQLSRSGARWASFDPGAGALREGLPPEVGRALGRRYYLVERARNASIVGILVGTLGVAGYRGAADALRAAARRAGKRTYTLLMGKPSPAKLANFPEIEVFVMVADPQGQILDSKEYLAPIITPHEAMLAFTPGAAWAPADYRLDFGGVAQAAAAAAAGADGGEEARFSLLDGAYHGDEEAEEGSSEVQGEVTALALRAQQALTVAAAPAGGGHLVQPRSAADFFVHKRSWTGVEAPIVGAEAKAVERAVPGRSGRAAGYADEPGR